MSYSDNQYLGTLTSHSRIERLSFSGGKLCCAFYDTHQSRASLAFELPMLKEARFLNEAGKSLSLDRYRDETAGTKSLLVRARYNVHYYLGSNGSFDAESQAHTVCIDN
jgi:hypothetical protein